ncbi:hypothetical protein FJ364_03135 [Candidatus Dependentiae bacterium]|nr:hypothetical protein [Candidatus Dependentiae bacterium]
MSTINSWLSEKRSAYLYRILANKTKSSNESHLFLRLSQEAENQAELWEKKIIQEGKTVPTRLPLNFRTRIIAWLINSLGVKPLRTILAAAKIRGMSIYIGQLLSHEKPVHLHEIGKRHHKSDVGNNLRAAVFGVNDGLVSNSALIFGIMGASLGNNDVVLLSGIAGLFAGAFSMAAGEYISVRSQRELFEYQIGLEAEELKLYPEEEAEELALIFHARGLDLENAKIAASKLIADPEKALDTLAKEELGIDPNQLASPWQAAFFSFVSFAFGALLPLLPFLIFHNTQVFKWSASITALSLFLIGAFISLFTGKGALKGGLRMLLIGIGASAVTYFVGHFF